MRSSRSQVAQDVLEDTAVAVIFHLVRSIDAAQRGEAEGRTVFAGHFDFDVLARIEIREALDRETVAARGW